MKVNFSAVEEFVEELRLAAGLPNAIADHIVRITCAYQPFKEHPHLLHVTVIAGALIEGKVVELRKACGMVCDFPEDQESQKTRERAKAVMEQLQSTARALELFVRKGVFEP